MKLFVFVALMAVSFNSYAEQLTDKSMYCISLKSINSYYDYTEQGKDDFAKRVFEKSECFIKKGDENVVVHSKGAHYSLVELLNGFKVWTKTKNINFGR